MEQDKFAWVPSAAVKARSRMGAFLAANGLADYGELDARADAEPAWFWNAVIGHFGIRFTVPYRQVVDTSAGMPWTRWCVGGRTNLVLNCLDAHRDTPAWEKPAIIWEGESGERRNWRYAELSAETCRLARALGALGVGKGDVVGLYMPMLPETMAAFFAIAKLGAIVLPMFSGFGAPAAAERLAIAEAKAVITVDATTRRGRRLALKAVIDEAAPNVPSLRHVVTLHTMGTADAPGPRGAHWQEHDWHALTARQSTHLPTADTDAEDPVMLMFTSGTSGRPKGTVHTHCGMLAKNALDIGLCLDVGPDDRLMWMTDMGWVLGPRLIVSTTLLGATIVLADGTPDYPDATRIWRIAAEQGVTVLGVAPTLVRSQRAHEKAVARHDLSRLRVTASTGEPWDPESWSWFFRTVCHGEIPILNFAGGTEIGGAIVISTFHHPLKPCAFGTSAPGCGAAVVDQQGRNVPRGVTGELVMRRVPIGLTRGLWREPKRYLESYWTRLPEVWVHGDLASVDEDGLWYIHGRADDVINVGGKRTGPAEVEALLMATGEIIEAAAVGVPDATTGESIACVCVGKPSGKAGRAERLAQAVAHGLGRPFRPSTIHFVSQLPKTRNMKTMRRVVRALLMGAPLGDLTTLTNPEAVAELRALVMARDE